MSKCYMEGNISLGKIQTRSGERLGQRCPGSSFPSSLTAFQILHLVELLQEFVSACSRYRSNRIERRLLEAVEDSVRCLGTSE
jgi:hypothetical protein